MEKDISFGQAQQQLSTLETTAILSSFQYSQLNGQQQSLVSELKAQFDEQGRVINRLNRINKINRYFVARLRNQVIHNPDDPLGSIITDLDRYRVLIGRIQRQYARVPLSSPFVKRDLYEILYDLITTLPLTKTKTNQRNSGRPRGRPRERGKSCGSSRRIYPHDSVNSSVDEVSSIEPNLSNTDDSRVRKSRQLAEIKIQSLSAALKSIPFNYERKRRKTLNSKTDQKPQQSTLLSNKLSAEILAKAKERLDKKRQTTSWMSFNKKKATTNILKQPTAKRQRSLNDQKTSTNSMFKPIYVCNMDDECRYETCSELELKDHQRNSARHQELPFYTCHVCHEVFHDRALLKDHRLIYHQLTDVLYRCSQCTFAKPFMERLRMHYKSHTAQPDIKCIWPGCEKMFRFKGNLAEHVKMHENGRNYKCSQCSYSCNTSCNLRKHILVHERRKISMGTQVEHEQVPNTAQQLLPQPQMMTSANYDSPNNSMLLDETNIVNSSLFYSHQGQLNVTYVNNC